MINCQFFRSTDDFNGAQCKAVCVEAGMIALRRESSLVTHEDFLDGVNNHSQTFDLILILFSGD